MNIEQIQKLAKDNSPTILSAAAVAGVVLTSVLTARATIKARNKLDNESARMVMEDPGVPSDVSDIVFTKQDTFKITWKFYIPAAVSASATITCIVFANRIGLQRNAALLAAAALADTAFREYKDEVVRTLGEKKHDEVYDRIAEKRLKENPPPSSEVVLVGSGQQLCYDMWSGRYFRSDVQTIERAVNLLNHDIIQGNMYADINEFYGHVGLPSIAAGEPMGWNVDNLCEVGFGSHISEGGEPCLAVHFRNPPKAGFGNTF